MRLTRSRRSSMLLPFDVVSSGSGSDPCELRIGVMKRRLIFKIAGVRTSFGRRSSRALFC